MQTAPRQPIYTLNPRQHKWFGYFGPGAGLPDLLQSTPFLKNDQQYLIAAGPWGIDGNHGPPGLGFISLVCCAYCLTASDTLKALQTPMPGLDTLRSPRFIWQGTIWNLDCCSNETPLVPWFQIRRRSDQTYVNYVCSQQNLQPILEAGIPSQFEITIDWRRASDWVCLGACPAKSHMYQNVGLDILIDDADQYELVDFGLIWCPLTCVPWVDKGVEWDGHQVTFGYDQPLLCAKVPRGSFLLGDFTIEAME